MTDAERGAVASAVEQTWAEMMAGARALDPERIRAGYITDPVVTINGLIIQDFDRDQFNETRRWLRSLQHFDASYDNVHLEVLSPAAAVATMTHHLKWMDSSGTTGEWNSAWTAVFRRIEGRWKIVHSHESTPQPT
jgi:ketosteroid isomerase-like protein